MADITSDKSNKISEKYVRKNYLPSLHVRGTHYEVGFEIGLHFKDFISKFIVAYEGLCDLLLIYESELGKEVYNRTLDAVKSVFPEYLEELQGISDGSKIPFLKLFLLHAEEVMLGLSSSRLSVPPFSIEKPGCTSVLLYCENNMYLAHDEDADVSTLNNAYLVHCQIVNDNEQEIENFVSYCYPGDIPGFCMGFNYSGFLFSVNILCPRKTYSGKIPSHFYSRALLSCHNLEEAMNLLQNTKIGCGEGLSVNIIDFSSDEVLMCNIEIAPTEELHKTIIDVHNVHKGEFYAHCNKYRRISVDELPTPSSDSRHTLIEKVSPITDIESAIRVLGDESDSLYPVFKNDFEKDSATLSVGVFDIKQKVWLIYADNPTKFKPIAAIPMKEYFVYK